MPRASRGPGGLGFGTGPDTVDFRATPGSPGGQPVGHRIGVGHLPEADVRRARRPHSGDHYPTDNSVALFPHCRRIGGQAYYCGRLGPSLSQEPIISLLRTNRGRCCIEPSRVYAVRNVERGNERLHVQQRCPVNHVNPADGHRSGANGIDCNHGEPDRVRTLWCPCRKQPFPFIAQIRFDLHGERIRGRMEMIQ